MYKHACIFYGFKHVIIYLFKYTGFKLGTYDFKVTPYSVKQSNLRGSGGGEGAFHSYTFSLLAVLPSFLFLEVIDNMT